MKLAFNWFLGANHLQQIIYNPCTGGCYDGLEAYNVNLNQGAESTVSYLMARLTMEEHKGLVSSEFISNNKTDYLLIENNNQFNMNDVNNSDHDVTIKVETVVTFAL